MDRQMVPKLSRETSTTTHCGDFETERSENKLACKSAGIYLLMSKREPPLLGPAGRTRLPAKRTRRSTEERRRAEQCTEEFSSKRQTANLKRNSRLGPSELPKGGDSSNSKKPKKRKCCSEPNQEITAGKRFRRQYPANLKSGSKRHLSEPHDCLCPKKRKYQSQPTTGEDTPDPPAAFATPVEPCSDERSETSGRSEHVDKTPAPSPQVEAPESDPAPKGNLSLYEIGEVLGEGSFGQVREARRKSDNRTVALKILPKQSILAFREMDSGERVPEEVFFQSKVRHPAIIELLDYFWEDDYYVMVMEKPAKSCDMMDHLTNEGPLSEDLARKVFRQLVDAVIHCEERGVFHRDIKNENIIVDESGEGVVKLTDFGLSSAMHEEPWYEYRGTFEFCPPEFFSLRMYQATAASVWQLGCVLVEMLALQLPYGSPRDALAHPPRVPRNVSEDARDLMRQMLARNGKARPSLQEIKAHPWLKTG